MLSLLRKEPTPPPSRHVRKLNHRAPVPRRAGDRLVYITDTLRRIPHVLIAACCFVAVVVAFHQYLLASGYFAMTKIEVTGNDRLGKSQILALLDAKTGIRAGESLFVASERWAEQTLEMIPEVADATVEKEWPSTLHVMVEERKAAGILSTPTASYVYDDQGFVFSRATGSDFRTIKRPMISGYETASITPGYTLPRQHLDLALLYLDTFRKAAPTVAKEISELHLDPQSGLTLVFGRGERFACGFRSPQETGPTIESLLATSTDSSPIEQANLVSELYVTVARHPADPEAGEKVIAKVVE
jgi:cell division septal protein FtsQ